MTGLANPKVTLAFFLATLGLLLAMQLLFPGELHAPLPGSDIRPVLLLEFASDPVQLEHIFGPAGTPDHAARVAGMTKGNMLDYLLMPSYGMLILSFFAGVAARLGDRKWLWLGWLGIIAALADAIENGIMFSMVADMADPFAEMAILPYPVWTKFGLLALTCGGAAIAFLRLGRYILALFCLPAPLLFVPGMLEPLTIGPQATAMIGLGWLAMALDAIARILAGRRAQST